MFCMVLGTHIDLYLTIVLWDWLCISKIDCVYCTVHTKTLYKTNHIFSCKFWYYWQHKCTSKGCATHPSVGRQLLNTEVRFHFQAGFVVNQPALRKNSFRILRFTPSTVNMAALRIHSCFNWAVECALIRDGSSTNTVSPQYKRMKKESGTRLGFWLLFRSIARDRYRFVGRVIPK